MASLLWYVTEHGRFDSSDIPYHRSLMVGTTTFIAR